MAHEINFFDFFLRFLWQFLNFAVHTPADGGRAGRLNTHNDFLDSVQKPLLEWILFCNLKN